MLDKKRYAEFMHLPLDWPRINQFPEYFTVENGKTYTIVSNLSSKPKVISGEELREGLPLKLRAAQPVKLIIE